MKKHNTILCILLFACALHAQTPVLLKDLYSGTDSLPLTGATQFGVFGDKLYTDGHWGQSKNTLWTVGPDGALRPVSDEVTAPSHFTEYKGALYFLNYPPDQKTELWKIDGATGQPSFVAKTNTSTAFHAMPNGLVQAGGLLYFVGHDDNTGAELWRSDGTAAGTFPVKDLNPGPEFAYITNLTAFGTKVLFFAYQQPNGIQDRQVSLFVSDGSAAGTTALRDFLAADNPYYGLPSQRLMAVAGSRAFFVANDGSSGLELWQTDGSFLGTALVQDLNPGIEGSQPNYLAALGAQVLFYATDAANGREVWRSDGTPAGTFRIKETSGPDGIPLNTGTIPGVEAPMKTLNGQVWFFYTTQVGTQFRIEVCRSNGTLAATQTVHTHLTEDTGVDLYGNPTLAHAALLGQAGGQMNWVFKNNLSLVEAELWKSGGVSANLVQAGLPSVESSRSVQSVGETLFFTSDQQTLWRTDGTASATVRVARPSPKGAHPSHFIAMGNRTLFKIDEIPDAAWLVPRRKGIGYSDGTVLGTGFNEDTADPVTYSDLIAVSGNTYFIKNSPTIPQNALYKITPSLLAPVQVGTAWSSSPFSAPQPVAHKNSVFFVKNYQIWQSDGTEAGTVLYFDPPQGTDPNYAQRIGQLASNGDSLYFINLHQHLTGPYTTGDLWRISGNPGDPGTPLQAGVYQAVNGGGGFSGREADLTTNNGRFILQTTQLGGANGNHFYGPLQLFTPHFGPFRTGASTVNGGDLRYYPATTDQHFFVLTKEHIRTFAPFPIFRNELWAAASGGTPTLLQRFAALPNGSGNSIGTAGNLAFFAADDSTGLGQELWRSDGTAAGTFLIKDIHPGTAGAKIGDFASNGTDVFFAAFDGIVWAIWRSDGTPEGTVKLANFPSTSVEPPIKSLYWHNKTLYFSGNDGIAGFEPWKIDAVTHTEQAFETNDTFALFPNPATQWLTLQLSNLANKPVSAHIVNHLGQTVKSISFETLQNQLLSIDVSDLNSGFYLVQFETQGRQKLAQKFVVVR